MINGLSYRKYLGFVFIAVFLLGVFAVQSSPAITGLAAPGKGLPPANLFPSASIDSIDPNPAEYEGMLITFRGSGTDSDGTIEAYEWSFNGSVFGTSNIKLEPPSTFGNGTHTISFRVQDDRGAWSFPVTEVLRILPPMPPENELPVVSLTASPTSGEIPLTVDFNGSDSYDPDGEIIGYYWDFGDETEIYGSEDPIASYVYNHSGVYEVTLAAEDTKGEFGSTTIAITVTEPPANQIPIVSAGSDRFCKIATICKFSGTATDLDGTVVSYEWDFGDATTADGATLDHIYNAVGVYTATLTVTDDGGKTGSDSSLISVVQDSEYQEPANGEEADENVKPTAVISSDITTGQQPLTVQFGSKNSYDLDGTISSYLWNFGTDDFSTNQDVTYTFADFGKHTVTLTVTDNLGATGTDSIEIDVTELRTNCRLEDFEINDRRYDATEVVGCESGGLWELFVQGQAIELEVAGPNKPASRDSCTEILPGWKAGRELHRRQCEFDNNWYWVIFPSQLKNVSDYLNYPYFFRQWEAKLVQE